MNSKLFGEKISSLRKAKGLTQAQLAEILNVSNKTISRWETGEGYPEITLLVPLAKTLGVTVDALLSDGEPNTNPHQGAEENSFSASSAYSSTYNKGKKEYKHREIPVEWPGIPHLSLRFNKYNALSNIIHIIYYVIFMFIIIDATKFYKYTDQPWHMSSKTDLYGNLGAGNFFSSSAGFAWIIAMSACFVLIVIFNIVLCRKTKLGFGLIVRNLIILTLTTAVVLIGGFSFCTGSVGFYSAVGIELQKIFEFKESNILNCDFVRIHPQLIAICGIAACSLYIISELIRVIVIRRKSKNNDDYMYDRVEKNKNRHMSKYVAFWKSLTIFNKISLVCVLTDIAGILCGVIIGGFAGITVAAVITANVAKAGLIISAAGLILGLLDVYDRQNKAAIILIIINLIFMYVIPLLTVAATMVTGIAVSGVADIISDVRIF